MGATPVYVASMEGHEDVVDLLIQAGADLNLATSNEVATRNVPFYTLYIAPIKVAVDVVTVCLFTYTDI